MKRLLATSLVVGAIVLASPTGVARADETVSGLELIELAHDEYDLQYEFGHGGRAVCELANVPEDAPEECLQSGEPFWGYWRGDGNGGWTWSGSGAHSSEVRHGDVEGWAWGEGFDGSSHQKPGGEDERITFSSVCGEDDDVGPSGRAALVVDTGADVYRMCVNLPFESGGEEPPDPGPGPGPGDGDNKGSTAPGDGGRNRTGVGDRPTVGATAAAPSTPDHRINTAPDVSELLVAAALGPSPSPTPAPTLPESATADDEEEGFPIEGVLAVLLTIAMAALAWLFILKRRSE